MAFHKKLYNQFFLNQFFANLRQNLIELTGNALSCFFLVNLSSCALAIISPSLIRDAALSW